MQRMHVVGTLLAVLGTALILLAALQAGTALLGESAPLPVLIIGITGLALLALGGGMMLHDNRP
ncbi:MAG TPA: hypothetical protein VF120_14245 [Ktedonobacterales bacterium]